MGGQAGSSDAEVGLSVFASRTFHHWTLTIRRPDDAHDFE